MAKINDLKTLGIILTFISLLWGITMFLADGRIKTIESEITVIKQNTMAGSNFAAGANVKIQNNEKRIDKIEEKLDR